MRLTASRLTAAVSCLLAAGLLDGARRPRYGGTLAIQMGETAGTSDPAASPRDAAEAATRERLTGQVFETLVELDAKGRFQPLLATSWRFDAARKRWLFTARPNVILHDGSRWEPPGGVIAVDDRRSINAVLRDLAQPKNAIAMRGADGTLIGTGPFRIAEWDGRSRVTLKAHDRYWRGRPYLDGVEIRMGRSRRDQSIDFELSKADVIEVPLADIRRAQQRQGRVVVTRPVVTLALIFEASTADLKQLREALALSVDRTAIQNVLLQRQGEISGALLPQWLSGYAFLFPAERDIERARRLAGRGATLRFAYDRQDAVMRSIAERIVLNAGEAGVTLRPAGGTQSDVRLAAIPITDLDPKRALDEIGDAFGPWTPPTDALNLYEFERALIEDRRIVPLFQIPLMYQLHSRVHGWPQDPGQRWRLQDVWVEEKRAP